MGLRGFRELLSSIVAIPIRMIEDFSFPLRKDSIEYWQRYIFYVISFVGIAAGTLCVIPVSLLLSLRGQYLETAAIVLLYALNVSVILSKRLAIKRKAFFLALAFYLFGLISLVLAGPEGESGIWFTVCVLLCSLFIGLKAALFAAVLDLLTGLAFGILHAAGIIGWPILVGFQFRSWLVQGGNIFFMDLMFAVANAILLRGVDASFKSLNAAESRIRDSLEEKEALIREIYHRSRNNMQVVSSLLSLRSNELEEEKSKAIFKDVINKIASMALVHKKLYESQDLANIDMTDYLEELLDLLLKSHGVAPGRIEARAVLEAVTLPIDSAIPCGLVISELVSNSIKYAFPSESGGRIDIAMRKAGDGSIELDVSDDGVGLPEGFDLVKRGKMGMKTVFTLVHHQMRGSIDFRSAGGLAYHIRFRRSSQEGRIPTNG